MLPTRLFVPAARAAVAWATPLQRTVRSDVAVGAKERDAALEEEAAKRALAQAHLKAVGRSVERARKARERSVRRTQMLQEALEANISAGLHVWVDPAGISGLWRAYGSANSDMYCNMLNGAVV